MDDKLKSLLLIVNPKSGKQTAKKDLCNIVDAFIKKGYSVCVHITQHSKDAENVMAIRGADFDLVVTCGGDGTLNETLSGAMKISKNRPVIGYIPLGSTNDFASTLKLSSNIERAIDAITNGKVQKIDIGKINDRYFSYIASLGAFTSTSYSVSQSLKNSIGYLAYLVEGLKDVKNLKAFHAKISVNDTLFEDDYIFCAVCNTTSIAGIVKLDENIVNLSDGLFEIILVRYPKSPIEFSRLAFTLTSREYSSEFITLLHSDSAEFKLDEPTPWSVDGEYFRGADIVKIKNKHNEIELML